MKRSKQRINSDHMSDGDGVPKGGDTRATGLTIAWDDGTSPKRPAGCRVATVVAAAIDRLEFEHRAAPTDAKSQALTRLQEAAHWLEKG